MAHIHVFHVLTIYCTLTFVHEQDRKIIILGILKWLLYVQIYTTLPCARFFHSHKINLILWCGTTPHLFNKNKLKITGSIGITQKFSGLCVLKYMFYTPAFLYSCLKFRNYFFGKNVVRVTVLVTRKLISTIPTQLLNQPKLYMKNKFNLLCVHNSYIIHIYINNNLYIHKKLSHFQL